MTTEETKIQGERILLTAHALMQCGVEKTPNSALARVTAWMNDDGNELTGSAPKNALKIAMSPQPAIAPKK